MLHYFLLILLNLLNNVILYQLWWNVKCLYEVQIPKCDWCSIGSQRTNIYGDLWREWEGVLFLSSNSGEDLHESIYRSYTVLRGLLIQMQNMRHGKKAKFWNFFFLLSLTSPLVLHFLSHDFHLLGIYSNISRLHFSGKRFWESF